MYSFMQERLCQWNARKSSIKEDFNQNGSLSLQIVIVVFPDHTHLLFSNAYLIRFEKDNDVWHISNQTAFSSNHK